jgi:pseudouridine synthase
MADIGLTSRRVGERLVREGKVLVNGKRAAVAQMVDPSKDKVTVDAAHTKTNEKITLAFHKPRGIVCSRNEEEGQTVFDLLPQFSHLSLVGRLDKQSEGLILLTNDGLITRKVTGADHTVEKEYIVTVRERLFPGIMERMSKGIAIDGKKTLPCIAKINKAPENSFTIVLNEGRKHQIRRMCEACKLTVDSLMRVRVGAIQLGTLAPGKYKKIDGAVW